MPRFVAVSIGVSALRKICTIVLSFVVFPKPFSFMYVYGAAMVVLAILMTAATKHKGTSPVSRPLVKTHVI